MEKWHGVDGVGARSRRLANTPSTRGRGGTLYGVPPIVLHLACGGCRLLGECDILSEIPSPTRCLWRPSRDAESAQLGRTRCDIR
jgi:hypothetical protein